MQRTQASRITAPAAMPKQMNAHKKAPEKCKPIHPPIFWISIYTIFIVLDALASNDSLLHALSHGILEEKELQQLQYAGQEAQLTSVLSSVSYVQYLNA